MPFFTMQNGHYGENETNLCHKILQAGWFVDYMHPRNQFQTQRLPKKTGSSQLDFW